MKYQRSIIGTWAFLPFALVLVIILSKGCSGTDNIVPSPGKLGDGLLGLKLDSLIGVYNLPALGIMYLEEGTIKELEVSGVRVLGHDEEASTADKWHLGSLTKSMTATMIARLVEQGPLEWSTEVGEIFHDRIDDIRPEYREIRLDQLLSHTSGLHNDVTETPIWPELYDRAANERAQRLEWSIQLMSLPPSDIAGQFFYANTNFIIAGAMAEEVTGSDWRNLIRQELFEPLGMVNSGFMAPGQGGQRDQPWGHQPDGESGDPLDPGQVFSDNPPAIGPAGVIHSTFQDYSRYMIAHLDGARGHENFLSHEIFQKLQMPADGTNSSLGWGSTEIEGGRLLSHDGSNGFWYTRVVLNTADQNGILIATNQGGERAMKAVEQLHQLYTSRLSNSK